MKIQEMAKADLEGIDLQKTSPKEAAKIYVDKYKKRTGKPFSKSAFVAMKKTLKDNPEVVKEAEGMVEEIDSKKSETKKDDLMKKNVKSAAKKAADVMKEDILKNAGISIREETIKTMTECDICKEPFTGKDMKYNVIDPYIESVSGKKVRKNICNKCYKKRIKES